jgi:hypothetical protein
MKYLSLLKKKIDNFKTFTSIKEWMELENIILSEVSLAQKDQKSYVLPHMRTLDQGQTQQGDWTLST